MSDLSEEEKDKWAERILKVESDGMEQSDETRTSNNKAAIALTAVSLAALLTTAAVFGAKVDFSKITKLLKRLH